MPQSYLCFRAYLYFMVLFFLGSSPIRHGNGTGRPNSTETSCYDVFFFHQLFFYVWHFSWCCQAIIFWSFCTGISHPLNLFDKKYAFLQEDTTFFLLTYIYYILVFCILSLFFTFTYSSILFSKIRFFLLTFRQIVVHILFTY